MSDLLKYFAIFIGTLLICLFVALFAYKVVRETPEQLTLSQENERLRLLNEQERIKKEQQQQAIEYTLQQQKLSNAKAIEQHALVFHAKLLQQTLIELWPAIVLGMLILLAFSQRKRFEAKDTFSDGTLTTRVSSKYIPTLIERAYDTRMQVAALADNRQEAFKMFVQLAQTAAALNRSHPSPAASAPAALPEGQAVSSGSLPAFRDILNTLEPGDPMVLGFEHSTGAPITGGFKRIYSCGIFGVSGSGKTTGLYSIIAQSLLLYPEIKYMVIDPHADRPEGLTKGLPKTAHFEHLDALNVRPGLTRFVNELDNRLKTDRDYKNAPFVLLIDELPVIMKSTQGQAVEAVLGRIANEGRKVDMFALIAGQDTRLKAAGGNRDLLTSQIAYNLRKKQARYLFDDSEIVDLHKVVREAKEPGLCVFAPTDDAPVLMKQPLCTPQDVMYVTELVSNGEPVVTCSTQAATFGTHEENPVTVDLSVESVECPVETEVEPVELDEQSSLFLEKIREVKESQQWSLGELSRRSGVDKGLLSKLLNGKEKLTPGVMENLKTLLNTGTQHDSTPSNVIPFSRKEI